jgi:predicted aconitase
MTLSVEEVQPVMQLDERDEARLRGAEGAAAQWAMQLLSRVAACSKARRLLDVTQAHLVGSYHSGPANLRLINWIVDAGARVVIPTTLNSSAADLERPGGCAVDDADFRANCEVVRAYQRMGCRVELTCAPYHLPLRPRAGENVAWAESNAVVFANSVLAARTNMTYQYLDLAAALTGRIPETGLYVTEHRAGRTLFVLDSMPQRWHADDAFYQLLGYRLGQQCGASIPVIANLPAGVAEDPLRSLGAAAASADQVTMFHAVGITPEAATLADALHGRAPEREIRITAVDIRQARNDLCNSSEKVPAAVCLGAPHFSLVEFQRLLDALAGRRVSSSTRLVVSTSRHNRLELQRGGLHDALADAGVELVVDTCTYYGRQLGVLRGTVMTNSAKWAHYAPGNLGVRVIFARLADCVETAVRGEVTIDESFWAG